jgi:hypothetical protein
MNNSANITNSNDSLTNNTFKKGDNIMKAYTADELLAMNNEGDIFNIGKAFCEGKCELDSPGKHLLFEKLLWNKRHDLFVHGFNKCIDNPTFKLNSDQEEALRDIYTAFEKSDWPICKTAINRLFRDMPEGQINFNLSTLAYWHSRVWHVITSEVGLRTEPVGTLTHLFAISVYQETFSRLPEESKHRCWNRFKEIDPEFSAIIEYSTAGMAGCRICANATRADEFFSLPANVITDVESGAITLEEAFAEYPMCRIGGLTVH